MIWQWAVIAVGVVLAVLYLVGVIRRTIKQPFCSDCVTCEPKKLKRQVTPQQQAKT